MLKGSEPSKIKDWVCVLERGTDYEVILAREYLASREIPSNVLSKKDSSLGLNFGELSKVYLYVPAEFEKEAREALQELDDQIDEDDPSEENGGH